MSDRWIDDRCMKSGMYGGTNDSMNEQMLDDSMHNSKHVSTYTGPPVCGG